MALSNNSGARQYTINNNIFGGANLRRMLIPHSQFDILKSLSMNELFVLSYIGHKQFSDELKTMNREIDRLKSLGLITSNNKTSKAATSILQDGVYPNILRSGEINKSNRSRIYGQNILKYKWKGKIITSNEWSLFDFQNIPLEPDYGQVQLGKTAQELIPSGRGSRGAILESNFNNNIILTPLCIEVGRSLIFHTMFQGGTTKRMTNVQYRVAVRDYCYFINEYGARGLRFLAQDQDFRPTGILVVKNDVKVGMLLLRDGNYYNRFDYNRIYSNYQDYCNTLKSILIT